MTPPAEQAAIHAQGLGKVITVGFWGRKVTVLKDLSLTVGRGEVFGLVGPNGAGKSTTIKMLLGFIRPTWGHGTVLGYPLGDRRARARLGYLPELPLFPRHLNACEVLDFHARLSGVWDRTWPARRAALLERVGLSRAQEARLSTYSKGMLQRCGLAVALCSDPELLVLDEPMSGLDPLGRHDVRTIIRQEAARGRTVVFSSHVLTDVENLCQHVAIISRGEVFKAGSLEELSRVGMRAVEVRFSHMPEQAAQVLGRLGALQQTGASWSMEVADQGTVQAVLAAAVEAHAVVQSVAPRGSPLEDLLLQAQARPRPEGSANP
jgi:ABC-2 type transport system ATP-binding protein